VGRETFGDGVPIVVRSWESQLLGEGEQAVVAFAKEGVGRVMRKSRSMLSGRATTAGEPDATETGTSGSQGGGRKRAVLRNHPG
jgi:hypothetical protein